MRSGPVIFSSDTFTRILCKAQVIMSSAIATVVPILAVICSNIQYSYPLRTALLIRQQNDLGALNPVPWAVRNSA